MNKTIKYINEFGVEINEQKIQSISNYRIIYFINDKKEKTEVFENKKLIKTIFSVYDQLEIDSSLKNNSNSFLEYSYIQNGYMIIEQLNYKKNIVFSKRIMVRNIASNNIICFKIYETIDRVLTHIHTEKKYFLSNGTEKYNFEYDSKGNAKIIYDVEYNDEKIYCIDIGVDPNEYFTWDGFEYYKKIDPLIPEK